MATSASTGGLWRKFLDLLPQAPRSIATVTTGNANGKYTVTLAGGGTMQVLGQTGYQVADKVFVAGQKIEGKAPTLTAITIDV